MRLTDSGFDALVGRSVSGISGMSKARYDTEIVGHSEFGYLKIKNKVKFSSHIILSYV
jgi:hypothetical protein